jgi:hypothetical protein
MSVADIGELHNRYVRLSDQFKSAWTYNQFAVGVYKSLLVRPLPYSIEFQKIYELIKTAGDGIQLSDRDALRKMDECEKQFPAVFAKLVEADAPVTPPILRKFFEKLRRQDDKIIFHLIKFYLYADAIRGDCRDKLDFLFTRIGEDYVPDRGEYFMKDSNEVRQQLQGLLAVRRGVPVSNEDIVQLTRTIRMIRDEIVHAKEIEELTSRKTLATFRDLKHRMGEAFFSPEVMFSIIECNVAAKNAFVRLYQSQEEQIIEDARRLLESESIAQNVEGNPELVSELARFRQFKAQYDDSRARSDVKHQVISQLKVSMNALLGKLDAHLASPGTSDAEEIFGIAEEVDEIESVFGPEPLLYTSLQKIYSILNYFDEDMSLEQIATSPQANGLRLESWEIDAFQKLFLQKVRTEEESLEMLQVFLLGAALRVKIEEEANSLLKKRGSVDPALLEEIAATLGRAKEVDAAFGSCLTGSPFTLSPKIVHRLYRSRLRLMRAFSGLWLLYDKESTPEERSSTFS